MDHTLDQLNEKFDQLPEEVQDFIMSENVEKTVSKIIADHHIQQAEDFRTFVFALLISDISIAEFQTAIQSEFKYSENDVESILDTLDDVLNQVWNLTEKNLSSLDQPQNPTNVPITIVKSSENTSKATTDIPVVSHPNLPSTTITLSQTPQNQPVPLIPKPQQQTQSSPTTPAPSILDAKLNAPTALPKEEIVLGTPPPPAPEKKPGYTTPDPYREPPTA